MRRTGFSTQEIAAILMREGHRCSMGCGRRATTANHRLNRKSGGRKNGSELANGCAICFTCNGLIEDDSEKRDDAIRRGVKLEEHQDPATTPMWHPFYGDWVLLGANLELLGVRDFDAVDPRTDTFEPSDFQVIEREPFVEAS